MAALSPSSQFRLLVVLALAAGMTPAALSAAQEPPPADLQRQLDEARTEREAILAEIRDLKKHRAGGDTDRWTLGGYGEIHLNIEEGTAKDSLDIHRLVFYTGYRFADWVQLHSELELEHAFVGAEAGGELLFEQLYIDFLLSDAFNLRAGRVLAPLGLINQYHEPPVFNGVERPSVDRYLLPSTWSLDGAGVHGRLGERIAYQLYLTNGLAGSDFDAKEGIRGGRLLERPGVGDPSVSGRVDIAPAGTLKLGASFFTGGLDNANKGANPGVDANVLMLSGDLRASLSILDLKAEIAHGTIDGADKLNALGSEEEPKGVAEAIFGYYAELAAHVWPDAFKRGKLADSDLVLFARYDDYDTQYRMPSGVEANPAYDRSEVTLGLGFSPVPNLVVKADVQQRDDGTDAELPDLFNMGLGWRF